MIQAIVRRKSNLRSRYIGRNHGVHGGRRTQEDEITSLRLGVLAYQPPDVVWAIIRTWLVKLCDDKRIHIQLPKLNIDGLVCDVQFWLRRNNVEPDVVIDIRRHQETKLRVLVEAKWNAGESGKDQFKKQREAFGFDTDPPCFVHLALLKSPLDLSSDIEEGPDSVLRTTWAEYVDAIARAKSTDHVHSAQLSTLANDLKELLTQLQLTREFSGIDLKKACVEATLPNSIKLFNRWSFAAISRRENIVELREWCFFSKGK